VAADEKKKRKKKRKKKPKKGEKNKNKRRFCRNREARRVELDCMTDRSSDWNDGRRVKCRQRAAATVDHAWRCERRGQRAVFRSRLALQFQNGVELLQN
jgi:hypothetical protein